jgi:hypothetical protein
MALDLAVYRISVARVLGDFGARPWQIGLTTTILTAAIVDHPSAGPA